MLFDPKGLTLFYTLVMTAVVCILLGCGVPTTPTYIIMVTIAQRYQKNAGIGTVIALMIPYVAVITVVWVILFIIWFLLGIPLGPGYPIQF